MNTTLRDNIDWVGYIDWTIRDFHSYQTDRGATYNSYLIRDEKTALIDAVKAPYVDHLLRNIGALTDPVKIDFVVANHAEPDHSGGLPRVIEALPNATLLCSKKCLQILSMYFDTSRWKVRTVATGDSVALGKRTLHFIETPMVHWPDSMFTYVREEKLLFSMDAFGQHYATSSRFDDEVPFSTLMEEAKTYYANIVMPFGKQVSTTLDKASNLAIEMIAPSHGLIWRKHLDEILKAYRGWAEFRPESKVLVVYDTMWDSTAQMARAILEGASQPGVEAKLIHIRHSSQTVIATEVLDAAAITLGSSTLNQGMMPMMGAVTTYLKGLRPANKAAFAFGSYGWGKGASEALDEWMKSMGWEILREPIRSQYRPTPSILEECRAAGADLASKAKEMASG